MIIVIDDGFRIKLQKAMKKALLLAAKKYGKRMGATAWNQAGKWEHHCL